MGDGLMALFGVDPGSGAALEAVTAGLEMLAAVDRLKPYLTGLCHKSFEIGIGLHSGVVVVGAVGAPNNKSVTAIGDAVNLASRVESANKAVGTSFLISEDTFAQVRNHIQVGRRVDVTLPGKSGSYNLYEVKGLKEPNQGNCV
jgi:adenylate cyclase